VSHSAARTGRVPEAILHYLQFLTYNSFQISSKCSRGT
jgi:hypothetical protein